MKTTNKYSEIADVNVYAENLNLWFLLGVLDRRT